MRPTKKPLSIAASRSEFVDLLGTNPSPECLEFVGLSPGLWQAILADQSPDVPLAVLRLARFRRFLSLADVLGPAWQGFELRGDALLFPGLKYPLTADDLRSTWFRLQELSRLRCDADLLRHDLAKSEAALLMAEKNADYWRRQVSLEARCGLMLSRVLTADPAV